METINLASFASWDCGEEQKSLWSWKDFDGCKGHLQEPIVTIGGYIRAVHTLAFLKSSHQACEAGTFSFFFLNLNVWHSPSSQKQLRKYLFSLFPVAIPLEKNEKQRCPHRRNNGNKAKFQKNWMISTLPFCHTGHLLGPRKSIFSPNACCFLGARLSHPGVWLSPRK